MAAWIQTTEDDPLFHMGGRPFRFTETLVAVQVVAWISMALAKAMDVDGLAVHLFGLSTGQVLQHGWVWQLATYPFVNSLSPFFVFTVLMLFFFGRTVERAIGRRAFALLYAGLTLVPAVFLCGLSLVTGQSYLFCDAVSPYFFWVFYFPFFVAFALLFPEAPMFLFGAPAKWMAVGSTAVASLIFIAFHGWRELGMMWSALAVVIFVVRFPFLGEWINDLREKQERAKVERERAKVAAVQAEKKAQEARRHQSIDPILEKISKTGMQSLTREERLVLEEARKELLRRDAAK